MRYLSRLLAIGAMFAAPAPAAAGAGPNAVTLRSGESITLALDDGGRLQETTRGPAPRLNRFEAVVVWNLTSGVYGEAVGADSAEIHSGENGVPEAPEIPRGAIRIKLVALGADSTLLVIENGYSGGLSYRATIAGPGKARATDVCQVVPNRFSLEHWPERIERIELSELRQIAWVEGQAPRCE